MSPGPPFGTQKLVPLYFCTFHNNVYLSDGQKKMLEFLYVQRVVQDINIYWGSFLRRWIGSKGFQNAIVTLSHPLCKKGSVSRALHCFPVLMSC